MDLIPAFVTIVSGLLSVSLFLISQLKNNKTLNNISCKDENKDAQMQQLLHQSDRIVNEVDNIKQTIVENSMQISTLDSNLSNVVVEVKEIKNNIKNIEKRTHQNSTAIEVLKNQR